MAKDKLLKMIAEEEADYVDIRFTDPRGKLQHVTVVADLVDEDFIEEGFMFDGSSIAGWKSIDQSDMKLMLDPASAYVDPFFAEKTICVHCNVVEPDTMEPYARDPRGTAVKAEAYLLATGIGDAAYMGPEAEFFIFDNVRFQVAMNKVSFEVDGVDAAWNSDAEFESGNMGHRPGIKGGYFPVPPIDDAQDLRGEMLSTMKRMGMKVDKHHHEVASTQHELGIIFGTLTKQADEIQKYKYVIHNVAHAYGKTATFMPKPIAGDNGSGMHVNMSIWKDGKPLFAGDKYADLSQEALWYIGGILKHAKALNAITNPGTNSYKRLIPGFEAPVLRAYSARNRSGCIRIKSFKRMAATSSGLARSRSGRVSSQAGRNAPLVSISNRGPTQVQRPPSSSAATRRLATGSRITSRDGQSRSRSGLDRAPGPDSGSAAQTRSKRPK